MVDFTSTSLTILIVTQVFQIAHTFFKEFKQSECKIKMKDNDDDDE